MKDLFETNWNEQLTAEDTTVHNQEGRSFPVVFLRALQRLARGAGMIEQDCSIITHERLVQAIFRVKFSTNVGPVTFVGAADCSSKNTDAPYVNYPTAIAESRAEARCLRKALNINMLAMEEIGSLSTLEAAPTNRADKQLVVAINKLCETKKVDPARVLENIITDKTRAASIFELNELTTTEAQEALAWLNKLEVQQSTKDKRDARKAELQAKQGK